ncbi:MAG TPA: FeoA family protein [Thiobacillus sp.]|nr:FeoA family protein [Thiobacillus sp.]HQT34729.1 FeoA family protein [Thiobacillus sp.]HQT69911.1 FeoA family protein [Thiobacillus sp.]
MNPTASTLDHSTDFQPYRIEAVRPPEQALEWGEWLRELGFIPGEQVMLMARAPGGDPLVVRVGSSTFALRRAEAACIEVSPLEKVAASA